jgi:hypothetical protein
MAYVITILVVGGFGYFIYRKVTKKEPNTPVSGSGSVPRNNDNNHPSKS